MNKYELALRFGVSHHTITYWRKRRLLPYVQTGYRSILFDLDACEKALKRLEIPPFGEAPKRDSNTEPPV